MHRDVKPSNILMDQNCGIHIIDFGLARRITPTNITLPLTQSQDLSSTPVLPFAPRVEPAHYSEDGSDEELESIASTATRMTSITRLERQLTTHVATRWYRAPEVLVMDVSVGAASES